MTKLRLLYFFFLVFSHFGLFGQNTVGLISYTEDSLSNGYNLFYPFNQSNVYLTDGCGQIVNVWAGDQDIVPGNSCYLSPEGNLIVTKRNVSSIGDSIQGSGKGESVDILSWENDLLYTLKLNNNEFRLHHDIEPLPNGNILLIAWNKVSRQEMIDKGRSEDLILDTFLLSESILEWNPELDSIVWVWNAIDHLVQDADPNKDNYGSPSENRSKIDINYFDSSINIQADWFHINSIDYNPVLDQILLSVPYFNEFWIIDHSTNTLEASSSLGGDSGLGGDLLYRWGNPKTYDLGSLEDQRLYFQHDVNWTNPFAEISDIDFNEISLFNNRIPGLISQGALIDIGFNHETWSYDFDAGVAYGPDNFSETFNHPENSMKAYSASVSSCQKLENGNILIFSGRWGYAYELDNENKIVWEYIIPVKSGSPVQQGAELQINDNFTFRMKRYPVEFSGFVDKDLSPKGYLELDANESFCSYYTDVKNIDWEKQYFLYPNPNSGILQLESPADGIAQIYDLMGSLVISVEITAGFNKILISDLPKGNYFFKLFNQVIKINLI